MVTITKTEKLNMNLFNTFGIDPLKFLLQGFIWFLILGIPAVMATRRVLAIKSGAELSLWLLFVWAVPLFGPYVTLYVVNARPTEG